MKKDNNQPYKRYFTNAQLAEIFSYSSVDSFNRSSGSKRIKDAVNQLILKIEDSVIQKIKQ
jgi:hypothetical protein